MLELKVVLDFACCSCGRSVGVTVKCAGKGLAGGGRNVATVTVPCPHCGSLNQLYFEPSGIVRNVELARSLRPRFEPSIN